MLNLDQIQTLLETYKYLILFPLAAVEGPIITIISGFLASSGFINPYLAYVVIVAGDLASDSAYYALGRFSSESFMRRFGKYIGLDQARLEKANRLLHQHLHKAFILGKISHGAGPIILFIAGTVKIPYPKFLLGNLYPTLAKSLILLIAGFYFGRILINLNQYFDYLALFVVLAAVALYWYFIKSSSKTNSIQ